jgi:cytochrome P450
MCCTDPAEHARRRRLFNLVFMEHSLKAANLIIIGHIDRWVEPISTLAPGPSSRTADHKNISAGWFKSRIIATWIDFLTFDILGDPVSWREL